IVKRQAREAIERVLPPASAALLAGLLLGERTALPSEIDTGFRRAGVYHLLAVSGFNVALVAGTTFALLTLVRFPRRVAAAAAMGVSLAAELAVLPITLVHFNQLSLIGPLANLGAVPLAGVTTIVGLAGVGASWVTSAAGEVLLNATWPVLLALRALVAVAAA